MTCPRLRDGFCGILRTDFRMNIAHIHEIGTSENTKPKHIGKKTLAAHSKSCVSPRLPISREKVANMHEHDTSET